MTVVTRSLKVVLVALFLMFVGTAQGATVYVASFGGHDYYLNNTAQGIVGARSDAVALTTSLGAADGYVVAINSAAEQTFLITAFDANQTFYIGLSDEVSEGTFVWDSGEALTYSNWNIATGEPNNTGNEDYVNMNQFGPVSLGSWNDLPADFNLQSIIEIVPVAAVPVPSSAAGGMALLGFILTAKKLRCKYTVPKL